MTTAPYIPTAVECGESWRQKLGLLDVEQARTTDHPMMGSFIRNECFVCKQTQSAAVHGQIHYVFDGEIACDPKGRNGFRPLMTQRTLHAERVTCAGCKAAIDVTA